MKYHYVIGSIQLYLIPIGYKNCSEFDRKHPFDNFLSDNFSPCIHLNVTHFKYFFNFCIHKSVMNCHPKRRISSKCMLNSSKFDISIKDIKLEKKFGLLAT